MTPRVSVVLPTYNRREYVEGAVETVFEQTYEDIEVVIVNDGSTDGTGEVLEQYEGNDRVQVIDCEENRGIAAARNQGTEAARGEFLCPLDDDDRWHPEKVEKQVQLMDELDDRYAVVYTWGENVHEGETIARFENNRVGDIYPEILSNYSLMPHSSHMIRKSHLEAIGEYDTDFSSAVDWDMCIRLAKRYRFECIPEVLVTRIVHDRNISLGHGHAKSRYQLLRKYRSEINHYPALEHELEARWRQRVAIAALEDGDGPTARKYTWSALRHEPTKYRLQLALLATLGPWAYVVARRAKGALGGQTRVDRSE